MGYFANFPLKTYNFGDNEDEVLFENLSAYIDIIDEIKDDVNYYELIDITDGDRPDTLSYKLYGTTAYYWTFFLMNEPIRKGGWPLKQQELFDVIKSKYPHQVVYSEDPMVNSTDADYPSWFNVGDLAIQGAASNPSAKGIVVERNLDLGQIVVKPLREVDGVQLLTAGSGYTAAPSVTVSGGGGTGAVITTSLSPQAISTITVVNGGYGYTELPTVEIAGGGGSGAEAVAVTNSKGQITEITVTNSGSGYISAPSVNIIPTTSVTTKQGTIDRTGFLGRLLVFLYRTRGAEITTADGGKVYYTISFSKELGSNGLAQSNLEGGGITGLVVSDAGDGYTTTPKITVDLPDLSSGTRATASASISSPSFSTVTPLKTIPNNTDNLSWDEASDGLRTNTVKGVEDQWRSVYNYKNVDGEITDLVINSGGGVDIPGTGSLLTPETRLDRFIKENDKLKSIKVLKREVVAQVFSEFQKFLRS
jgi:hypothetical protein